MAEHAVKLCGRPYWVEKINGLASQYHSLQKELTQALGSAVIEPAVVQGNVDHSTK